MLAQSIAQRTREIGIRMALGADRADILGGVMREGARLMGAGIGIGAVIALGATRALSGVLYGISASDPINVHRRNRLARGSRFLFFTGEK